MSLVASAAHAHKTRVSVGSLRKQDARCVCVCVCVGVVSGGARRRTNQRRSAQSSRQRSARNGGAARDGAASSCVCVCRAKKREREKVRSAGATKKHTQASPLGACGVAAAKKRSFCPTQTQTTNNTTHTQNLRFEPNIRQLHCRRRNPTTTPQNRHTPQPTTQTTSVSRL